MPTGNQNTNAEPRGFGEHTRGLSGEYAHEQGWGLDVEERTRVAHGKQDFSGGKEYDYGARDFGDEPTNMQREDGSSAPDEQTAARVLGVNNLSTTEEK